MGGRGSGQWYRWNTTTKLDNLRSLDINRMMQTKAIPQNGVKCGSWVWSDRETGERTSSLNYYSDTACNRPYIRLQYTIMDTEEECDYKIYLGVTWPHYGGKRFWFICPYTGKRVTKLYRSYGSSKYASRHAFKLSYASQSEAAHDRALRKKWKILRKMDGDYDFPVRPKGMHHKTYEKFLNIYWEQEEICDAYLFQTMKRYGMV